MVILRYGFHILRYGEFLMDKGDSNGFFFQLWGYVWLSMLYPMRELACL